MSEQAGDVGGGRKRVRELRREARMLRVQDWLIGVWNAVAYRKPIHPDEGIEYKLTPRWRRRTR